MAGWRRKKEDFCLFYMRIMVRDQLMSSIPFARKTHTHEGNKEDHTIYDMMVKRKRAALPGIKKYHPRKGGTLKGPIISWRTEEPDGQSACGTL